MHKQSQNWSGVQYPFKVAKEDICIVTGDLFARVGKMEDTKCGKGKFGLGERNDKAKVEINYPGAACDTDLLIASFS